jgi:hypothetical protein
MRLIGKAGGWRKKLEPDWTGVDSRVLYARVTKLLLLWAVVIPSDGLKGLYWCGCTGATAWGCFLCTCPEKAPVEKDRDGETQSLLLSEDSPQKKLSIQSLSSPRKRVVLCMLT